ncbi:ACP S-malonyltransferase [Paenibacillus tarimensis]|uniref:ACP S-malonyltransferase n=1 Tax=Paenibacillus tarimensis TaxID=416012 RepID=UPI001F1F689A|nr:ACP S-malonyltransferase [Paenibacillus tarimensis]MCF2943976.1 ACP S-malonyltransferase [Paenibacillus tarimensis]
MITYVFPGQGSQFKGMGEELFDEFPEITAKADEVLGYSIKELCLKDPYRQLGQTQYTQPALYTVNVLSYMKKLKVTGRKPDYTAGHSLGEYCALFAAGAFSFEQGLRLVQRRGQLMSQAAGGGMAAVLGLHEQKVVELLLTSGFTSLEVANFNTPTQIVISGAKEDIGEAASLFESAGASYVPLNVSGAFHSRNMEEARASFAQYLELFTLSEPAIPVISNVYARPYQPGRLKQTLSEQITSPVKWTESVRYLMGLGAMDFVEVGPGHVLTKLVEKIRQQAGPLAAAVSPQVQQPAVAVSQQIQPPAAVAVLPQVQLQAEPPADDRNSYDIHSIAEDVGKEIERLRGQVDLFWGKELKKYKEYGLRDGLSIVEFGCGPGYVTEKLLRHFPACRVTGIEFDPYLVDVARSYLDQTGLDRYHIMQGSIMGCAMPSNSFDFAVIRLVIEHLPDPVAAIKEVHRVLKPGGVAVFIDNDFEMHIRTYPHIPELKDLYDAYCRKRESEGGMPMIGRQLPVLLKAGNFENIDYDVICAHNHIVGDELFAKSEGLGIPMKLVREGFLDSKVLGKITVKWRDLMKDADHVITRQLYISSGEKR